MTEAEYDTFAKRLKLLIRAMGMKQRVLAGRAGIDESQMSKILNGEREPSLANLAKIMGALDEKWSARWLLMGDDQ